jgi:hypothetical protein
MLMNCGLHANTLCRLGHDQLRGWVLGARAVMAVDILQLLVYIVAYVGTVLCTPLDDALQYESDRNPDFYLLPFNDSFTMRLNTWHALNIMRTIAAGLGWLLVSVGM